MIELMKELCALPGPSGCEDAVRAFVLKRVKSFADEIRTDAIGNVMVFRKGRKALDRPVAVCAHMDEVGVIIKKITEATGGKAVIKKGEAPYYAEHDGEILLFSE